jgi:hypothetical protein
LVCNIRVQSAMANIVTFFEKNSFSKIIVY